MDPTHLRDLTRQRTAAVPSAQASGGEASENGEDISASDSFDRSRRIRDAVEAALSDVILLGTEAQVRLAARAATDLVARRPVHTDELVISLRDFIREVLDLEPVARDLAIPKQGPTRPSGSGASSAKGKGGKGGGDPAGAGQDGKGSGGGGGGVAGGMGLEGGLAHGTHGE